MLRDATSDLAMSADGGLRVVGGGPAGITAALQACELGARVTLLEAGQTSDAVKLSSSWRKFVLSGCGGRCCLGGECGGLVVVLAGGQAVVQAAEEPAEQVSLGGGVPVAVVAAAVVVGAGAG